MTEPIELLPQILSRLAADPETRQRWAAESLRVDSSVDISDLMRTQSGDYWLWGSLADLATAQEKRLKHHMEHIEAECALRHRADGEKSQKKPTEPTIAALVKVDPIYLDAQAQYHAAAELGALFRTTETAMAQRKDMLQSINARQCREMAQSFQDPDAQDWQHRDAREGRENLSLKQIGDRYLQLRGEKNE